jgi:hypothetical protein
LVVSLLCFGAFHMLFGENICLEVLLKLIFEVWCAFCMVDLNVRLEINNFWEEQESQKHETIQESVKKKRI